MSLEKNKAVAIKFLDAIAAGRLDEVEEMMAPDFTWWNPGPTPPFGHHKREDFIAISAPLRDYAAGPLTFKYGAITAEEDRVAVEGWSNLPVQNGKTYANTYHFLFTVRGDQIVSGKEFLNPLHVLEVFGEYFAG